MADGDCYAMGGVAGHAGVFSTVTDLGNFARQYLARTQHTHSSVAASFFLNTTTVALFTSVHNSTQSSRALGWNTNSFEVVTSLSNSDVKVCVTVVGRFHFYSIGGIKPQWYYRIDY